MQKNNSPYGENEFWNVVQNAINTGNYQELNHKVQRTINDTVEGVRNVKTEFLDGLFGMGTQPQPPANRMNYSHVQSSNVNTKQSKAKQKKPVLYMKNPSGKVSGLFQMIGGFGLAAVMLPVELFSFIVMFSFGGWHPAQILWGFIVLIFSAVLGGSLALGITGLKKWNMVKRFQEYVKIIGERSYCEIKEFQALTGRKRNFIVKDLKRMIMNGFFTQGHLDKMETCLIVSHEMFRQYCETEANAREQQLAQKREEEKKNQIPEACRTILEEGKAYIAFIHQCNDILPGELISTKLDRLELLITRIFAELEKKPSLAGDLRRFMNYYLPTTKKLIQAYCDLEYEPISSENIKKTKTEIENTLDTINQAFEKLLNSFFDTTAMDISADISVLNTMFAQEGLTGQDFHV